MNITTYVPARNSVGQYTTAYLLRIKQVIKTLIKVAIISYLVISFLSLFATYYLLKTNYVVTCTAVIGSVTQDWHLGHFMSKNTCDEIISDRIANLTVTK